jgi:hypothetical protein
MEQTAVVHELKPLTREEIYKIPVVEVARRLRQHFKERFPGFVFSITTESYSMGCSLKIAVMSSPVRLVRRMDEISDRAILSLGTARTRENIAEMQAARHHQLNTYTTRDTYDADTWNNGVFITEKGHAVLKEICTYANHYNYDDSDPTTDYYSVHFSFDLHLGKWDKPFVDGTEE